MRNSALLVAGMVAVVAVVGCSDRSVTTPPSAEQSTVTEESPGGEGPAASDAGGEDDPGADAPSGTETVAPEEASGSPAPTVAAQEPGSPLLVSGAQLNPPEGWQVSGVSS